MLRSYYPVGEGLPGAELVRSHIEGREGRVRRVIELVGNIMNYQCRMYYLGVYDEASLEPVPFPKKRKRRKTPGRWYVPRTAEPEENMAEVLRGPRKGALRSSLTEKTGEAGIVGFLMEMKLMCIRGRLSKS